MNKSVNQKKIMSIIFVKRHWANPIAALIRWAIPVSRFKWARSCHCMVLVDDNTVIHSTMASGVVKENLKIAMKKYSIVEKCDFEIFNDRGFKFLENQIGKPYDFFGALGLSFRPGRNWQEDDRWFCFELAAAALHKSGRKIFKNTGHVTDAMILSIKTEI